MLVVLILFDMKKTFTLICVLLAINCFSQITTVGLVRHYSFSGNANDSTINAQHGTVTGATLTNDRFGSPNSAYSFNGSGDYIEIPVAGLLLNQYTYTAWANAASVPAAETGRAILSVGTNALANPQGGDQVLAANNMSVLATNGWGGNGYNVTGPNQYYTYHGVPVVPNVWVHVALTRSANVMRFYFNCQCVKVDSTSYSTNPKYGNTPTAKIGTRGNNTMYFHGEIDEVRIYDRPLTDEEILLMCREQPVGVAEPESHPIEVFPNPASDHISVKVPEYRGAMQFELYDTQGRIVVSKVIGKTTQIPLDHLEPGIYVYHLFSGDSRQSGKIVRN